MIVDLFAGVGWAVGLSLLGMEEVGIDVDRAACATRAAAGFSTIRADVTDYPPERFAGAEGLLASPPCQSFSRAGKRAMLADPRGQLVWEPVRWAEVIRPRWIALEQVPDVLPIWRLEAKRLDGLGYSTWTGLLHSEQWGVPQNRTRVFLLASLDRPAVPPTPTHQRYAHGEPARWGTPDLLPGEAVLRPWVSMADGLGWSDDAPRWVRTGSNSRRSATGDDWRDNHEPYERSVDVPAPTVETKAWSAWSLHTNRHHEEDRSVRDSVHVTVPQLGVLQSFAPDFPWRGNKTEQGSVVGNAVPPLLAAAVVGAISGLAQRSSERSAA